jgi:phage gpG-like protein
VIEFKLDDRKVMDAFARLQRYPDRMRATFQDIGEYLIVSTKERFKNTEAPDGSQWAPKSVVTLALQKHSDTRPLHGESGRLASEWSYQATSTGLDFGSPLIQSAVMQFGAKRGEFGETTRGQPIPFGDIPAREMVGISGDDETAILEIANEHLEAQIGPTA